MQVTHVPENTRTLSNRSNLRKSATQVGGQAINQMIRKSADYVGDGIKARYGGKNPMGQIANDIRILRGLLNTEMKQVYTQVAAAGCVNTTPIIQVINPPVQGDTSADRDGDSIKVKRFDIIMSFQHLAGTASTSSIVAQTWNWYLVRYKKTPTSNGTTPFTITDMFNADQAGNVSVMSFPNPDTNQNFQVMATGQVVVELPWHGNVTTGSSMNKVVTVRHECDFHQVFDGSAAANITDNCCFVVITASQANNASGGDTVAISVAQWFVDN